jgi:hypothetical protein
MIVLNNADAERLVEDRHWPTVQEILDHARQGVLDETTGLGRPDPESRAAFRAEIAALKARRDAEQRQAELDRAAPPAPAPESPRPRKRRSA